MKKEKDGGNNVVVIVEGKETKFKYGDAIFVPPDIIHQFKNNLNEDLLFLCLVPNHD